MTTVWPTNAGMIDIESSRQNIRVRFPGSGLVRLKIMLGFMLTHFVNLKYDYRFFLSTNLLSVSLNRLSERLSIIENYHTVSLAPLVTNDDMGSSKSVRVCQESSLEIIKSGSTDSTELIGSICNGQAGCSWDDSIADQIKDPCSDVFKYMSVEYNCGK